MDNEDGFLSIKQILDSGNKNSCMKVNENRNQV